MWLSRVHGSWSSGGVHWWGLLLWQAVWPVEPWGHPLHFTEWQPTLHRTLWLWLWLGSRRKMQNVPGLPHQLALLFRVSPVHNCWAPQCLQHSDAVCAPAYHSETKMIIFSWHYCSVILILKTDLFDSFVQGRTSVTVQNSVRIVLQKPQYDEFQFSSFANKKKKSSKKHKSHICLENKSKLSKKNIMLKWSVSIIYHLTGL